MITKKDREILLLLMRSRDSGDGWRNVSKACWPLVESFDEKKLLEIDSDNHRVRLSPDGNVIVQYSI